MPMPSSGTAVPWSYRVSGVYELPFFGWVSTLGPTYHRPSSIQRGRLWKFELAYD
jgi:hypothetical protein